MLSMYMYVSYLASYLEFIHVFHASLLDCTNTDPGCWSNMAPHVITRCCAKAPLKCVIVFLTTLKEFNKQTNKQTYLTPSHPAIFSINTVWTKRTFTIITHIILGSKPVYSYVVSYWTAIYNLLNAYRTGLICNIYTDHIVCLFYQYDVKYYIPDQIYIWLE
jgi:hypothetical protein